MKPDGPGVEAPPRATHTVAVVGGAVGGIKTTAAINLAVALAMPGRRVWVCDLDPTAAATRALGCTPHDTSAGGGAHEVRLSRRVRGQVAVMAGLDRVGGATAAADATGAAGPPEVAVVDCAPIGEEGATRAFRRARLVLVPVDASPAALSVIDAVAGALGGPGGSSVVGRESPHAGPRLRLALGRVLPRSVDRWAVVERLAESYPGALYATTIPMGRRSGAGGARPATLYAPTTRAAAAYAALAREVWADLDS